MKTNLFLKKNPVSKIDNQRGSTLLPMLVLASVIAISATSILIGTQSRLRVQSHSQAREDANNLETSIRMIFTSHNTCKANIGGNYFGTSVDDLKNLSANRAIKLSHTNVSGNSEIYAGPNMAIGRATITGISFVHFQQLDSTTSYIADMNINLSDGYGVALKSITVPFYFATDPSGAITDCIATSYPQGQPSYVDDSATLTPTSLPRLTMEDILCEQSKGANNYYSPTVSTCVNTTMVGTR